MPPITSMVASKSPSRRARGWEELGPVCGTGALKLFWLEGSVISRPPPDIYAFTVLRFLVLAMRASRRCPRHPHRNEIAITALVWRWPVLKVRNAMYS